MFVHISVDLSRVELSFSFIVPDIRVLLCDLHLEPNSSTQLTPWKLRKVKYVIEYSYLNSRWCLSFQLGRHPGSLIFLHTILQPLFSIVVAVNTYSRQSGVGHLVAWSLKPSSSSKPPANNLLISTRIIGTIDIIYIVLK